MLPKEEGADSDTKSQTGTEIFVPRCSTSTASALFPKKKKTTQKPQTNPQQILYI